MQKSITLLIILFILAFESLAQKVEVNIDKSLSIKDLTINEKIYQLTTLKPLLSFIVNDKVFDSRDALRIEKEGKTVFEFGDQIQVAINIEEKDNKPWQSLVTFFNNGNDTLIFENVIPFGTCGEHTYITSTGPWALARAKVFRPGLMPVGVIVPDNAWELGYGSFQVNDTLSVCALARRIKTDNGRNHRYKTYLYPGDEVSYKIYVLPYQGDWQNGLRKIFRDQYLFDLDEFDNTLYERSDLQWIKSQYLIALQFAWDHNFYNWETQEYTIDNFLSEGKDLFGGYDIYGLWPTWPRLGVDNRNQWDMFSSLRGGLNKIKEISQNMQDDGTRFFICYNPWDESTRKESPYKGMARLIEATDANGVVLDCHGWSSQKYQEAADSIKDGVIMYSEGMAVVKDMPGIISGRVHNAIYMSPPLNINKLIKPDFSIFRVVQRDRPYIHREVAIAFFNGYGTEINYFFPGKPESTLEDFKLLAKTTMILRENTSNFQSQEWTPLIPSLYDSIWVNKWPGNDKTIYTVLSFNPDGIDKPLFEVKAEESRHYVSLYHHETIDPEYFKNKLQIPVTIDAYNTGWVNTRREGNIDCIAELPEIIEARILDNSLIINAFDGDELRIWKGNPSYSDKSINLVPGSHDLSLFDTFNEYEGKIVIQLMENGELIDEAILFLDYGKPLLIIKPTKTGTPKSSDGKMIYVKGNMYTFHCSNNDQFIPYPYYQDTLDIVIPSFYIDKYPVTNKQYYDFIKESGYAPSDTSFYLRHWKNGKYPEGLVYHPVVYIDITDAKYYAKWAGKRLPTQYEWQFAAQGNKNSKWPWGDNLDSTKCNYSLGHSTPVGAFPEGISDFGVMDMVGNVWQLTGDIYNDGSYTFVIMKGGSFYNPQSSWWYVKGGPQPVYWQQMLLLVNPGLNRNATVGFRCVRDE